MSWSNRLLKYGVHAAVTAGALWYISGYADTVQVFGTTVPLIVAAGGLGIASSVANDFAHSWILPMISVDKKNAIF